MKLVGNMPPKLDNRNGFRALILLTMLSGCLRTVGVGTRHAPMTGSDPFPYPRLPVRATLESETPESDRYRSYQVTYPSRDRSDPRNLDSRALLRVPDRGVRGLIVVLPILGGDYGASDLFACDLSEEGFSTLRFERKADAFVADGALPRAAHLMQEAVVDVRRGLDWAEAARVPGSHAIGLVGISMGSFIATLVAASDSRVKATVLALGGGDLVRVMRAARSEEEIEAVLSSYEAKGIRDAELDREIDRWLGRFDPLRFAARLDPRATLMVHARFDGVIPFERGTEVWVAAGRPARGVTPTGHYSSVFAAPWLVPLVRRHFETRL
ncbi:MAG: hypothetical protein HY791_36835 [Deltaproteobacteria bacterium]|nr:hypothetical protein [Deltaproteobacteria bacterium]